MYYTVNVTLHQLAVEVINVGTFVALSGAELLVHEFEGNFLAVV